MASARVMRRCRRPDCSSDIGELSQVRCNAVVHDSRASASGSMTVIGLRRRFCAVASSC